MAEKVLAPPGALEGAEKGAAAAGSVGGFAALFSAAACCVLPLVLAAVGLGTGGLAAFVPYHWPLTIASAVAIAVGWLLYLRRRRACSQRAECANLSPGRSTLVLLSIATGVVALSAVWPGFIEQPLMRLLGGA